MRTSPTRAYSKIYSYTFQHRKSLSTHRNKAGTHAHSFPALERSFCFNQSSFQQMLFYRLFNLLRHGSHLHNRLASHRDEEQRRQSVHVIHTAQLLLLVRIHLQENHLVLVLLRQLLHERQQFHARTAPRRPEIDHHRLVALAHKLPALPVIKNML